MACTEAVQQDHGHPDRSTFYLDVHEQDPEASWEIEPGTRAVVYIKFGFDAGGMLGAGGIPVRLMGLPPVLLQPRWWPHIKVEARQLEVQWPYIAQSIGGEVYRFIGPLRVATSRRRAAKYLQTFFVYAAMQADIASRRCFRPHHRERFEDNYTGVV